MQEIENIIEYESDVLKVVDFAVGIVSASALSIAEICILYRFLKTYSYNSLCTVLICIIISNFMLIG